MSFVTTPTRTSAASSRQSAAMRLLLPEPTGPPTPTRNARSGSADKEALRALGVTGGRELEAGGGGRRLRGERSVVSRDLAGGRRDPWSELREPARRLRRIESEQLQGRRCDGRGVVVEGDGREL